MTSSTSLPIPDLPTPITTPDPVESDPSQLPVEPELDPANPGQPLSTAEVGVSKAISNRIRSLHVATRLRFMANQQFMRVATFRWPSIKASSLPT